MGFRLDKMEGEGTYVFTDGRTYAGQWQDGHMSGHGKMSWPSGAVYEGGHLNDAKHGEGAFTWPDGRVYRGQSKDGHQDGTGLIIENSGAVTQGIWRNGEKSNSTA